MGLYGTCPACGAYHDDGAYLRLDGRVYLVCFDCADAWGKDEISEAIRKRSLADDRKLFGRMRRIAAC